MELKFYVKSFIRNAGRQKSLTFLGIGSLSLGIAVALLIGLWVLSEINFDHFHEKGKAIYRLYTVEKDQTTSGTFRQVGDRVKQILPEVKEVCRIAGWGLEVRVNPTLLDHIPNVYQVEDNFFTFFSFPLKLGNPSTCLKKRNTIVISETVAERWFGKEDPIGKIVQAEGNDLTITGMMKDFPYNSHIQADIVMSFGKITSDPDCPGDMFRTYFYVPEVADLTGLEHKLTQISDETVEIMKEVGAQCKLQRLEDIHFGIPGSDDGSERLLVLILAGIGLAVLLLACINFVNLYIARAFLKFKALNIMKACGAGKKELAWTIMGDTLGYVLIAAVVGVVIARIALPGFNQLADYRLTMDFSSPLFYFYLLAVIVITSFTAGGYPVFYIFHIGQQQTLPGQYKGKRLSVLQQGLLVVQFTVSIVFLISILFVHKQVNYMLEYDLGYDQENVVFVPVKQVLYSNYTNIRNELQKEPAIKEVTMRTGLPMSWSDGYPVKRANTEERFECEICNIEENYFDMMGIKFLKGSNPLLDHRIKNGVVIDELAVKRFNLENPIGEELKIWGRTFVVKGVVNTVKAKGLNRKEEYPLIYMPLELIGHDFRFMLMCKIQGNPQKALKALQKQWETYMPSYPFQYKFLDDIYQEMYDSETRLGNIFLCAMIIMFLLSGTGLFAMAYYTLQQRRRELGVRKVNGAGEWELLMMLNLFFIRLVALAYVIACLLAWYFLNYWLEQFVVQTTLNWEVFAGVGGIAFLITLITVCYQTIRAARVNPIEVLKNE